MGAAQGLGQSAAEIEPQKRGRMKRIHAAKSKGAESGGRESGLKRTFSADCATTVAITLSP